MAFWQVWSDFPGSETAIRVDGLRGSSPGTGEPCVLETQRLGLALFSGDRPVRNADPLSPYHEMLAHVPMCAHPHPTRALLLGGADGAALEILLSYGSLESLVVAGFSRDVAVVAAEAYPEVKRAFSDQRVRLDEQDSLTFVRECRERFDVILFDPAESMNGPSFPQSFFCDCFRLLSFDGVMACDCGPSDPAPALRETCAVVGKIRRLFPVFRLYLSPGRLGVTAPRLFGFASKTFDPARSSPTSLWKKDGARALWYNDALHRASFALPTNIEAMLENA